jgi:AcrR family transcriptional regulator
MGLRGEWKVADAWGGGQMAEKGNRYKDRMRDNCMAVQATLMTRKRISMQDLADECGMSLSTAYRWVDSYSRIMPITIERGIVTVGIETF